MKRLLQLFMVLFVVAALAAPVVAASSRSGKRVYKKTCKSCHTKNGEGGKLSPLMKTQAQWRTYFNDNRHQDKPEIWKGMSEKQQKDLLKFFLDFALDSDQPETCG
ncbi:c-type cytochrome [Geopsychrobacter electrodiphilus]|uniref:c-type cytochrome n=1 Tax=Geopsychrobacter electrodiphilus TaxID=225196 RepID=UPI0003651EED|nr:c-type cytochrome [Geopsychrobacter electrodiphilus]